MLPTSVKEEERKLGAASTWGKKQLKTLGVDFLKKQTIDLNARVMRVRGADMPSELRQSTFICCADSRHPRRSRKASVHRSE